MGSLAVWMIAQSPQLFQNYRNKSVVGLSPVFLIQWMMGDLTNVIGSILTEQTLFQIIIAFYMLLIDMLLYIGLLKRRKGSPFVFMASKTAAQSLGEHGRWLRRITRRGAGMVLLVKGLSLFLFFAAFVANLLYSINVLANPRAIGPDARAFLSESLPFLLGSGGTLIFDFVIMVQWIMWHERKPSQKRKSTYGATDGVEA
ncbi:hypothetical protein MCUN1_000554 [Malassezia cuniculi]|uniref:Uncharacterized protein n=1 Tax=Malassezia cuniculi TaxID=948313 RepID=A0AAF0ERQ2_9BASI|nr:hypothetical protein MCUN1_000554 [Malassezia cuniculi]